jgi:hypothetical protein
MLLDFQFEYFTKYRSVLGKYAGIILLLLLVVVVGVVVVVAARKRATTNAVHISQRQSKLV